MKGEMGIHFFLFWYSVSGIYYLVAVFMVQYEG